MKTDYLYALENVLPVKRLGRTIISVTNLCNSRCKTCSLWKNKKSEELSLEELKKFSNTKEFQRIKFLILTGGETFLRKDLFEIVNMFKKKNPNIHITILTNALLPKNILEQVKKMPRDVLITMSFNGKEETHDKTRGVKGNFKLLLKTIENLKSINQEMNLIFTVTKENFDQLLWSWEFAKKKNYGVNALAIPEYANRQENTIKKPAQEPISIRYDRSLMNSLPFHTTVEIVVYQTRSARIWPLKKAKTPQFPRVELCSI